MVVKKLGRNRKIPKKQGACSLCVYSTKNCSLMRKHYFNQHPDEYKKIWIYPCDNCDDTFMSELAMKKHQGKKHPKHTCRYCDKEFPSEDLKNSHINIRHPTEYLIDCEKLVDTSNQKQKSMPEYDIVGYLNYRLKNTTPVTENFLQDVNDDDLLTPTLTDEKLD